MRRSFPLALLLCAASTAVADPTLGTYRSAGTHSTLGAFTGEVVLERGAAPGAYALRGRYRFSGDQTLTWSGQGRLEGGRLVTTLTYETPGLAGALDGGRARDARGGYAIGAGGALGAGGWRAAVAPRHRVRETLTLSTAPTPPTPPTPPAPQPGSVVVDLVAAPAGQPLAEDREAAGVALAVNLDDDDQDGGRGGDGETRLGRDRDDADGTRADDDLVAARFAAPSGAPAGATLRLVFPAAVGVYRDADRRQPLASGATLPLAAGAVWLEGREAGEAEVALEVVAGGQVVGRDAVPVKVARSAFLLCGHGCTGRWYLDGELRSRALDRRTSPTLVRGATGAVWAVYVWDTEKQAKLALSTPGAVISYDGHSNFGMGYAFATNFATLSDFMNIADPQIPVNWPYLREHQDHPRLVFSEAEYGDDLSTSTRFDPVATLTVIDAAGGPLKKNRWPLQGGAGTRFSLTRGAERWHDHHYGDGEGARLVVRAGAKDMPEKRWSKLFLNSCYSGGYYIDSFGGRGTLFFSTDEASSTRTSGLFLLGYIDGKSDDQVLEAMNAVEDINDYKAFGE